MRKATSVLLSLLLIGSFVLAACGGSEAAEEAPAAEGPAAAESEGEETISEEPAPEPVTLTIGFTQSQTGSYETPSGRQTRGFDLWMKGVNDRGGVVLSDGSSVTFQSVSYDDESSSDRVQELYTLLATEDDADFLISPYSSGLTAASSVIAEQYGKVMITTGAASDSNYTQGYTQVYQIYTPASRYLTGALDLLQQVGPEVADVAFVFENDQFSTDVVQAAAAYAAELGYNVVLNEGYDSATVDFGPFINKIESSGTQAILGGGHFQDGSTFARQLYEKGTEANFFALLVAPPEPDFADLGDAAVGIIGPSQWEPLAAFTAESAAAAGLAWYGPSSDEFVTAYVDEYDEEPSYHSAGGYAAGLVLEKAILDADSVDPAAVKAALDAMDVLTFYGSIRFDTSAAAHGLQIGHSMVYIQWQLDADANLAKQVVWPFEGATAETLYPLP